MNEENLQSDVAEDFEAPVVAEGFDAPVEGEAAAEEPKADPAEEAPAEGAASDAPVVPAAVAKAAGAPVVYSANHKFKAMGQEKEFDPWAKKLIKDAETEKQVRELYEKAHGLEPVKQKLHRTREAFQEVSQKHNQVTGFIEESIAFRDAGDYGKLFEYWKIDPVSVAKWLSQEIEMNDPNTPPHVKESYRRSVEATRQNIALQRENRSLESSHGEVAERQLAAELHATMSQPDVAQVMQSVDGRTGKAGTFYNMVVRHAIATEQREGRILSADEAVKEVMDEMGIFLSPQAAGKTASAKAAQNAQTPPPTLPKAPGSQSSPTRKGVRSTEDLRKLYNQKFRASEAA